MTTVCCFVFVEFRPIGYDQFGLPYSLEPRKWMRVLTFGTNPSHMGLPFDIEAVGYSEWPTSLNLEVNLDENRVQEELLRIRLFIPGVIRSDLFTPVSSTPPLRQLKPGIVIHFPLKAHAA